MSETLQHWWAILFTIIVVVGTIAGVSLYIAYHVNNHITRRSNVEWKVSADTPWYWQTRNQHRDGIPWWEAPVPPRLHKCRAQTRGWIEFKPIERCACGGVRYEGHWIERNQKRKDS